jgi:hypothetical protein
MANDLLAIFAECLTVESLKTSAENSHNEIPERRTKGGVQISKIQRGGFIVVSSMTINIQDIPKKTGDIRRKNRDFENISPGDSLYDK